MIARHSRVKNPDRKGRAGGNQTHATHAPHRPDNAHPHDYSARAVSRRPNYAAPAAPYRSDGNALYCVASTRQRRAGPASPGSFGCASG